MVEIQHAIRRFVAILHTLRPCVRFATEGRVTGIFQCPTNDSQILLANASVAGTANDCQPRNLRPIASHGEHAILQPFLRLIHPPREPHA